MTNLTCRIQSFTEEMTISTQQIIAIAQLFNQEIANGLRGEKSSLKVLPAFLATPTGKEKGQFLALDFGGTNIRVLLMELQQDGQVRIHARRSKPLKDPEGTYDYIRNKVSGEDIFDFIASLIADVIQPDITYYLGHTFSFASRQTGINDAQLIQWEKEFNITGVEGRDINGLLVEALERRGINHVIPKVIINDTVGTLLAAAYGNSHVEIGSICGTGHNTAYLEKKAPLTGQPMIINLESGDFNQLQGTVYDKELDKNSERPGEQGLEKMVGGCYLGELFRLVLLGMINEGLFSMPYGFCEKLSTTVVSTKELSIILGDDYTQLLQIKNWLADKGMEETTLEERLAVKEVAERITQRSARLVAATYIGIITHIDPSLCRKFTIGIDGSLYEKLPGYPRHIKKALAEVLGDKSDLVTLKLTKDGSGMGAAIAVAIVVGA